LAIRECAPAKLERRIIRQVAVKKAAPQRIFCRSNIPKKSTSYRLMIAAGSVMEGYEIAENKRGRSPVFGIPALECMETLGGRLAAVRERMARAARGIPSADADQGVSGGDHSRSLRRELRARVRRQSAATRRSRRRPLIGHLQSNKSKKAEL
jgi:hypothetical protein